MTVTSFCQQGQITHIKLRYILDSSYTCNNSNMWRGEKYQLIEVIPVTT